ncbi:uncharacterized protein LOC114174411 [Vigna unguiculata]|uniref:uncharacterized protein LOC114174411 n=1 Tax=Vigna unguiculata TaxID=3917 RepID=UPI001016750A|nr:uncharacterized protein LOC114174411 [Vigna unguiculata]
MEATHVREKGLVEGSEHIAGGKQNEEVLKNIIATHPLYEVLIQSHINCLKEAYCMALSKLKEAIEEPTKETNAFIRATYHELKQLEEVKHP